jgi:glycosyltransferase involved in cell wall biosynthesis
MDKIIIIFSSHRTLESGGVGTHLKHLINEIAKTEYEYYVLLGTKKKYLYKRFFYNIISKTAYNKQYQNILFFMNLIFCLSGELDILLKTKLNKRKNTEIIVHCHDRETVFATSFLKKKYNIKIIQTLHAPFSEQFEMTHPNDYHIRKYAGLIEPGLSLEADHFIAVDTLQKQIIEKKLPNINLKISEIVNSVDINIKIDKRSFIKQKYNVDEYIVVARHLNKKNGVEYAIKAFALIKSKNLSLFIVGDGPERNNLENLVKEWSLGDKIFFVGRQTHQISLNIIAHAKLSLVPSIPVGIYIEATSLTMLESMLLEVPVIASNIGGLKQVLDNYNTGILVNPQNEKMLSTAIDNIVNDKFLYSKIQKNAKNLVLSEYNSEKWFHKISEIYNKL